MRLLIVNHEHPPVGAGAGAASRLLARSLVGLGHEVTVVTAALGDRRGMSVEDGVRIFRIPAWRTRADRSNLAQMGCFAVSALARAFRIARRERIEASIAFFALPAGLVARWLAARSGIPYLVSLRGGDVPGLVPELERWHRVLGGLRRAVLRSSRAVVANSEGLAQLSQDTDPFRVEVIPNAVDTEFFRPAEPARGRFVGEELQILFSGRLQTQKNLGLLLEELASLRREGRGSFRLHVAGDGPRRDRLRQLSQRLGLDGAVEWHGWLGETALVELYQAADCLVVPSLYEGLPNAVLEAMASALPVIASDVPGNDALVVDGETGILFPLGARGRLAAAVTRLMDDPAEARRMGAAGRRRAAERFSLEATATAYLDLLRGHSR